MNKLMQVYGTQIELDLSKEGLQEHFDVNDKNHATTILTQINDLNFYRDFFKDRKDLVVLDIGANIGLFSLHVLPACKRLIAYEPTPSHFQKMQHLTQGTIVEARQKALNNSNNPVTFNIDATNSTMNSLVQHTTSHSIEVQSTTLSSILSDENLTHVDFCKIDIEGSEMIALTKDEIRKTKLVIKAYFVEVHPTYNLDQMTQQQNKEKLIEIFFSNGYTITDINFETFFAERNNA